VELYPARDTTAASAADALLKHVGRYGSPHQLLSDNGSQYVNDIIVDFLKLIGTEHVLSIAYSHEENAIVERVNKEIIKYLRAIMFDKNIHTQWSTYIPLVQRIINSEIHTSTGVSPANIIYGNAINLNRGIFIPRDEIPLTPYKKLSSYMGDMLHKQQTIIEVARQHQLKLNEQHMLSKNSHVTQFPINSYVLVDYPDRPPTKLHPIKKGPMKVINNIGAEYVLLNLVNNKEEHIHISRLSPFIYDLEIIDPRLIANKDYQEFDVECILNHSGSGTKSSTYEFLVQWTGYSEEFNRWLPWKELRNNPVLHDYLRRSGLQSMIPREHR
jgi:hypothetical protein